MGTARSTIIIPLSINYSCLFCAFCGYLYKSAIVRPFDLFASALDFLTF